MKSFYQALSTQIQPTEIATRNGLSYLAAATALSLAGRPEVTFVDFDGQPFLAVMGGALVAVDLTVPGTTHKQRTWLPVMDRDHATLSLDKAQSTDINNSRQRALVKAIACVHGDGMSLYMGHDGDGAKAIKSLGVAPESDLAEATPVVSTLKEAGAMYIEWGVAIAAARITDPTFFWEVVMWDGLPYRNVLGGMMVDVDTIYRGKRQRLSLPVYDAAFNQLPCENVTAFDWNKTVMRALTKCLAFNAGYGLSVYAGDEFGFKDAKAKVKKVLNKAPIDLPTPAAPEVDAEPEHAPSAECVALANEVIAVAATPMLIEPADAGLEHDVAVLEAEPLVVVSPVAVTVLKTEAVATVEQTTVTEKEPVVSDDEAKEIADTTERFKEVMRKRYNEKGLIGLVGLFEAIQSSTKFKPAEKPTCYRLLTTGSIALLKEGTTLEELNSLLLKVREFNAMNFVAPDSRELLSAKLVRFSLEAALTDEDNNVMTVVITDLVAAGVALNGDDVIRLATLANIEQTTIDLVQSLLG